MKNSKHYTIGVLVSGIMDEFTESICTGVINESKAFDVDIVVFPAKYYKRDLSADKEIIYEYQYNMLFNYTKVKSIDALIIAAGSIGCYSTKSDMAELLSFFDGIPCILIAYDLDGYTSINFDNYQGIKDGLEYILNHSNAQYFGMVGGNIENTDALERKNCFYDTLRQNGIPDENIFYVEGDFTRKSVLSYSKMLDNYPKLDSVFCVNDDTAIGFYEEAKRRGLRIGKDISILGYDDTLPAAIISPPLSTVRADSWKLGKEALKTAISTLNGDEVKSKRLTTSFVKRASIHVNKENYSHSRDVIDTSFESIFYRFIHNEMSNDICLVKNSYEKILACCNKIISQSNDKISDYSELNLVIDDFISSGALEYADIDRIITLLQQMYDTKLKEHAQDSKIQLLNIFFIISNKLSYNLNQQFGKGESADGKERYALKFFVQNLLQFEKGSDASYGTLLQNMEWLEITDAALYTFDKPIIHLEDEAFCLPSSMMLKAVLSSGQVKVLSAYQQRIDINDIFANDYYNPQSADGRVALPLFCNEVLYGLMVCNLSDKLYTNGEFLINQISSAVKVINLLHLNESIQIQLEENLHTLEENNVKLDTLSKSDPLTGIYNRRGFYEKCEARLTDFKNAGKSTLVIYVDMNNLKIINDRYGHNEGDYSIKLIARFLQNWVSDAGFAGRIGGDEYACMLEYDGIYNLEQIVSQIYEMFENYNATSDKPYNITVSAGGYILTPSDELGLSEALQKADEKLYIEKLKRKKEVAKK